MRRSIWFAATVAWLVASGSLAAQGRGQAGEERVDWNAKMPWGTLEKAVQAEWAERPRTDQKTEPFKIFDNLYYVGVQHVASYLVPTGEGSILIDATYAVTADMVLDNIRRAGFDPADIKYIVLTHAHFDHFGGIGRIKQVAPDARVVSTSADWDEIERQQASGNPDRTGIPLTRDMVVSDGQVLTLGNTTLKLHHAPGHSPGALGIELEARDGERTYRLVNPCVGLNNVPPAMTQTLVDSMVRLKALGPWDGVFASHGFLTPRDPYISPRDFILGPDTTKAGPRPHPAIQGAAAIDAWFDHVIRVAREKVAAERQAASN